MEHCGIIQAGIDYIEANLKTGITAAELADRAGFSLYHYYRLFQQETGMPVMQFILRRRLLHAIVMIENGSTKTDAALEYGFDTYAGFYKAFVREFGCTPWEYISCKRVRQPYRLDLKKEEHMIITRKKCAEILKNWILESAQITDIYYDNGNKSDNAFYVGEEYVLKLTTDRDNLEHHIELIAEVGSDGINAGSIVKTADGRDYVCDGDMCFYLTCRVRGCRAAAADFYSEDGPAKARFVGEIIGQLHLSLSKIGTEVREADLYGTVAEWALPAARRHIGGSDGFWEDYLRELSELHGKLPRHIIHRDPNPSNIIASEGEWGVIDFELAERNVRIYDPCYAATAILSESFDDADESTGLRWLEIYRSIILGYDSVAVLTDEEWAALPYTVLANQLVCVAFFSGQEKFVKQFKANKSMTDWLISVFDRLRIDN